MNAEELIAPTISEPLTWMEICERHPDEWVCLVEIDRIDAGSLEFRTARVVGHGKTRRAPLAQARPWRELYKTIGHYFTERPGSCADGAGCWLSRLDVPGRPLAVLVALSCDCSRHDLEMPVIRPAREA